MKARGRSRGSPASVGRAPEGAAARGAAARAVAAVTRDDARLDDALADVVASARLSPRDAALAAEIAYGVVRWHAPLAARVRRTLARPQQDALVEALCLVGLYQLDFLRVPPHAAVSATVAAVDGLGRRWARGFVNGVLRALQRTAALPDDLDLATVWAHPPWLFDAIRTAWPDHWQNILTAGNERPPMVLRVDIRRLARAEWIERARQAGIEAEPHPAAPAAVTLSQACAVTALPGFDEGLVSVQDAAAQQAATALDLAPGQRVLDACAAPGGKTIHCLQSEPDLDELVALDISPRRTDMIEQDLRRTGCAARVVTADATQAGDWWDGRAFDRVLLDAPCSGSGVIRRHPDIKLRRTRAQVDTAVALQDRLLDALWPVVAPGGCMLYATCSILPVENEARVTRFLEDHPDASCVTLPIVPGFEPSCGVQFLPGVHGMDGMYFAALRKAKA